MQFRRPCPLILAGIVAALACSLLFVRAVPALAVERWVSVLGSDTAGLGTKALPYQTITFATSVATAGDEVWVGSGTYPGNVEMRDGVSLFSEKGSDETTIVGSAAGYQCAVYFNNLGVGETVQGFSLTGAPNGVGCNNSSPHISDNRMVGNTQCGVATGGGSPLIERNVISGNASGYGGGGVRLGGGSPMVVGNLIESNTAPEYGGGLLCASTVNALIRGNTIRENTCTSYGARGGGGIALLSASAIIEDNTIVGNDASWAGAGLYMEYSVAELARNIFSENSAAHVGAAVKIAYSSSATVTACVFSRNTGAAGGAIYAEGSSSAPSTIAIIGSLIESNTVGNYGAAATFYYANATLRDSTIVGNNGGSEGCITAYPAGWSVTAANIVVWGNSIAPVSLTCSYSDVQGGVQPGTGNISAAPSFVSTDTGDYRLRADSPCIDAATATVLASDYAGVWRPQGVAPDMGAYEYFDPATSQPIAPSLESTLATGTFCTDTTLTVSVSGAYGTVADLAGYWVGTGLAPSTGEIRTHAATLSTLTVDTDEGEFWVSVRAGDVVDNWSDASDIGPFWIDRTPPSAPDITSPTHSANATTNAVAATFSLTATEPIAPFAVSGFCIAWNESPDADPLPNGLMTSASSVAATLADGRWYAHARARDGAGNWSAPTHFGPIPIESNPPTLSSLAPEGWRATDVTIGLSAVDDAGLVERIDWILVRGGTQTSGTAFTDSCEVVASEDGTNTVEFSATDEAGNRSATSTVDVFIDKTPPFTVESVPQTSPDYYKELLLTGYDALNDCYVRWSLDEEATQTATSNAHPLRVWEPGEHILRYWAVDAVGNASDPETLHFAVTWPAQISLSTGSATIAYGGSLSVKGKLASGSWGLQGQHVVLLKSTNGSTFATASALTTTGPNGEFAFTQAPASRTWYRVRSVETSGFAQATSGAVYAYPRAKVLNPIAPYSMYRSRSYTVYGSVYPYHSSGTVRIYKYRYVGGRYISYGFTTASIRGNRYSALVRLPYAGRWRLRSYHADTGHAAAWSSGYDYVTVR